MCCAAAGHDNGDYGARMKRLKSGDLQFAVASMEFLPAKRRRPGLSRHPDRGHQQSKGGDALVARSQVAAGMDQLRAKRVAFTPGSASEQTSGPWGCISPFPSSKSPRAAGAWKPRVRRRLWPSCKVVRPGWRCSGSRTCPGPWATSNLVKLMGTDDTEGLIVDVLLVGRKFAQDHPDAVAAWRTISRWKSNSGEQPEDLVAAEVVDATQLSVPRCRPCCGAYPGPPWWKTVPSGWGRAGSERLVESIQSAVGILREPDPEQRPPADGIPTGSPTANSSPTSIARQVAPPSKTRAGCHPWTTPAGGASRKWVPWTCSPSPSKAARRI